MPKDPESPDLSPALEKRRAVETAIGGLGRAVLVFLAGGILVLLTLFGRQLFELLVKP